METQEPATAPGDELTEPEQKVWRAAETGPPVNLQSGDAESDNPARGASWGAARTVRAELLVELLTGMRLPASGRLRAVRLRGARISGQLDLEAATLVCPLVLRDCHLDQPVNLMEARALTIRLPGCHTVGVAADGLETRGDLDLGDGFTAHGEVRLLHARIGGSLSFNSANLINPGGRALHADGLKVEGNLVCREGFTAQGEVRLGGARIGGQLALDGASLIGRAGRALSADGLTVEQGMFCDQGFTAQGMVSLVDAHIGGQLAFIGAHLTNPDGMALAAPGLTVGQSLFCRGGFIAQGEVHLIGARIGGQVDLNGARLIRPGGRALTAERLAVGGGLFCRESAAVGEVRLLGAHIGGELDLSGARLAIPGGVALYADVLTVGQAMFCREGFAAVGEVRLLAAQIGHLDLAGAHLTNPDGRALTAARLTVKEDMFCRAGFTAQGEVLLVGARIHGQLDLSGATFANPGGLALNLEGLRAAALLLQPQQRPDGGVELTNAQVGSFRDDQATWPAALGLRGFAYERLETDEIGVGARLRWLGLHPGGYTPQVYEQLAATYRRAGRDEAARRVLIAKQWRRRRTVNPLGKLWNLLLYATVGYGYRTWLAAPWLIALVVVGTVVFDRAYPAHMVASKQPVPRFHPVAYTLDVLLPIVDLGQQSAWIPRGGALYWSWVLIGAGWVLTTAAVAGLTGILKRD